MAFCTSCVLMLINAYALVKNRLKKTIVNLLVRLKGNSKCTSGTYNSLSSCPIVLASTQAALLHQSFPQTCIFSLQATVILLPLRPASLTRKNP